ncbi:LLM class flavin-dependent oxidoreductase [Ramlibacter sp.]|uniref:LLM class flavin-dependent oxidoreductase n=1 Tax=Ramlibacter sp. TaxID=1917967 RepID=UPI003D10DBFA
MRDRADTTPGGGMTLVAFMQAQNCSNYAASWRHPEAVNDFLTPQYYQRVARTLEDAKFHLAFFDDRLAMPDIYQQDFTATVRHGIRAVKLDLIPIMTAMGLATSRLGIGGTYSTTYYEPYHVARVFATLDLMIGGRSAWNVVTSLNDSEAFNFGQHAHLEHDARYDRADEFIEVVLGHWTSWDRDALIMDRKERLFADPAKVRRLDFKGKYVQSRGPFTVPQSPQGHPVIIQAGQSGRGKRFAAQWGELIFVSYKSLESGRKQYAEIKQALSDAGRDPDKVRVVCAIYTVVAPTHEEAVQKAAVIDALSIPVDGLTLLSEIINFDFGSRPYDEPLSDADMASMGGMQTMRDRVVQASGKANPSPREFVEITRRGTMHDFPLFIGTPSEVADGLEEWYDSHACDGFVVAGTHVPGGYEDFARLVVPELQRRGLFRTEYRGTTLRENLGLELPVAAKRAKSSAPANSGAAEVAA